MIDERNEYSAHYLVAERCTHHVFILFMPLCQKMSAIARLICLRMALLLSGAFIFPPVGFSFLASGV